MSDDVIARLRQKIVVASLAAVLASLAALIFAINLAHYLQTDAGLRSAMDEIASELDTKHAEKAAGVLAMREGTGVGEDDRANAETTGGGRAMHGGRKSARTQYASRFFCVFVGADGTMTVRSKGNGELADDEASDLARRALASGGEQGYLDDYKYVVQKVDDQTRILFLDCTTELQSLNQLLVVSLVVGGCAFAVAALFVHRFSHLAVRPLEESARKQKQFVADASHELKTPLSVIATNMDLLEMDLADQPEELEWITARIARSTA